MTKNKWMTKKSAGMTDKNMLKQLKNIFNSNWFWAMIVFLISFFIYVLTLAPSVSIDDSGELISAAVNLGIPHPSGYPLWTLLGHIFSYLPFGASAWRINLMSAFFSALTATVLFLLILEILRRWFSFYVIPAFFSLSFPRKRESHVGRNNYIHEIPAFAGMTKRGTGMTKEKSEISKKIDHWVLKSIAFSASLFLAFTNLFWANSVVAEVYTLNVFFVCLIIYLLLLWQDKKENKFLLWTAFLFGLSLTNHQMMALIFPAFLIFIISEDKKIFKNPDLILKCLCLFVLGLLVYFYLPIAAHFKPVIDWGQPDSWQNFWAHISRQQYSDFISGFNLLSKIKFLGTFVLVLARELYFVPCVLALAGIWLSFKKNFNLGLFLLLSFLSNNILIIFLRHAPYGMMNDYMYESYYLPSLLMMIIWLAVAAAFLWQKICLINFKKIVILKILVLILILLWPFFLLTKNWQKNDQSNFWLVDDYVHSMLKSIEPNAILIHYGWGSMANDTEIFSLVYALTVEKIRPDIYLLTDLNLWPNERFAVNKEYLSDKEEERRKKILTFGLKMSQTENRPLYTDFSVTADLLLEKIVSRSLGNIYKIFPSLKQAKEFKVENFDLPILRQIETEQVKNNLSMSDILSRYYYRLATYYLEQGQKELTNNYLQKAIFYDRDTDNRYLKDFMAKRAEWQGK